MKKIREYLSKNTEGSFYLNYMSDDQIETMLVDHFEQVGLKITGSSKQVNFEDVAKEQEEEKRPYSLKKILDMTDELLSPVAIKGEEFIRGVLSPAQSPQYDLIVENLILDTNRKHYTAVVKTDLKGVNKAGIKVSGYYNTFERHGNGVVVKNGRNIFSESFSVQEPESSIKTAELSGNTFVRTIGENDLKPVSGKITFFFDKTVYESIKWDMFTKGLNEAKKDKDIEIHISADQNFIRMTVSDTNNKNISFPRAKLYAKKVFDRDGSKLK